MGHQKENEKKSNNIETDWKGYIMLIIFTGALTLNSIIFQIDNSRSGADYLYYFSMIAYLLLATKSFDLIENWGIRYSLCTALIFHSAALLLGKCLNFAVFETDLVGPTASQILSAVA